MARPVRLVAYRLEYRDSNTETRQITVQYLRNTRAHAVRDRTQYEAEKIHMIHLRDGEHETGKFCDGARVQSSDWQAATLSL